MNITIQKNYNNSISPAYRFNSKCKNQPSKAIDSPCRKFIETRELPSDKLGVFKALSFGSKYDEDNIYAQCFFVRMQGYEKNLRWGISMVKLAQEVSDRVSKKEDFDEIIKYVCSEISKINSSEKYGKLKGKKKKGIIISDFPELRGGEYLERYSKKLSEQNGLAINKSNEKYKYANVSSIENYYSDNVLVYYPYDYNQYNKNGNLGLCKDAYSELIKKENPTEEEILETCATIQWLIYQECPFEKGNDSIANILTKGIMDSYDIRVSPLKEGVSFDFEAFDTSLDEYIKKYPTLFEEFPHKIRN